VKILLVNGSPNEKGNTHHALTLVETALNNNGVETEHFHIGKGPFWGCTGCLACRTKGHCVFEDDPCNKLFYAIKNSDGVVIGTPVYLAGPNGGLCAILDRVFKIIEMNNPFVGKPAVAVATCVRAGATATIDRLNKYFNYSQMPVVSSLYWNVLFAPGSKGIIDEYGIKTMQTLGENMASLFKKTAR
jgi:multimeric flavodoxin WrbA